MTISTLLPEVAAMRAMRKRLKLTQRDFAIAYRLPYAALIQWESGRREPRGVARTLIWMIAKQPDQVWQILHEPAKLRRREPA